MTDLEAVPAFYATDRDGRSVPFVVSLLLYDANGRPRLPPAAEVSINRTVDITGCEGVALATLNDRDVVATVAKRYMERAFGVSGVIVLFRCQSGEAAERLMQYLNTAYVLKLVQYGTPIAAGASHS